ncbi:hypothetical protein P3T76_000585 [Phytophthora citrophthora]|uniref:Uncharacterized protein n=1 Tax=Phytophthora citrophthora TaxID=4793 RepID=A0AAD9H0B6_9STRA|nr:hypothetical protein P3T76_000585 [Phytophthora citrophthora]
MAARSAKTVNPLVAVASPRHHGSLEATIESELYGGSVCTASTVNNKLKTLPEASVGGERLGCGCDVGAVGSGASVNEFVAHASTLNRGGRLATKSRDSKSFVLASHREEPESDVHRVDRVMSPFLPTVRRQQQYERYEAAHIA